ncbi:3'-5' exonuclease [Methanorbis rubei]|uniref:DNA polymerase III PolC-type n=1 Tax=Methanorbis rubei TaxID=3028300 RepID=A0AAE4MGN1_9EURY|nr:DNA polymerase III PolC-type [Methanocorpusculaceae archaeon Cs1]
MISSPLWDKFTHIIALDTETSGLDPKNDRIIELAAISVDEQGIQTKLNTYIQLPVALPLSQKTIELTGITRDFLQREGVTEQEAAASFVAMIQKMNRVLFIAHNAQFDLCFLQEFLKRNGHSLPEGWGIIDTLTVFRDRKSYPNKLSDAIKYYELQNVQNTHSALTDAYAVHAVFNAMQQEQNNLHEYLNLIGVYTEYELFGWEISGLEYWGQTIDDEIYHTLPEIRKRCLEKE